MQLDVTSEAEARAAVENVVQRVGGLDLLMNAAGILARVLEAFRQSAIHDPAE